MRTSRRGILGGLGASAALWPLVPLTAREAEAAPPRRLVVFFVPNGCYRREWEPAGGETSFQLRQILKPLEPYRSDLLILKGLDFRSYLAQNPRPPNDHDTVVGQTLTGTGTYQAGAGWYAQGPSIDQYLARRMAGATRFGSLTIGVRSRGTGIVYTGPRAPVLPESDPRKVFARLFSDLRMAASGPAPDPRLAERRSVIDLVRAELASLRLRVGQEDRGKLDAHLEGVRALERRLAMTPAETGPACRKPELGATSDAFAQLGRQQLDNLVAALACDLTRIATVLWSDCSSYERFSFLGVDDPHHALAHYMGTGSAAEQNAKLVKIMAFHAQQLAYLIRRLKEIPEGTGSLLDNTAILWCSEHGRGESSAHERTNLPFLIAGRAGGSLRTGRVLEYGGRAHNDLFVSLCHALGFSDVKTFGDPAVCAGPLPGLR